MLKPRTLKTLLLVLATYGLLLLIPGLSIYVFHKAGVAGLLEHNGQCRLTRAQAG